MNQFIDLLREITVPSKVISPIELRKDVIKSLLHNFSQFTENKDCKPWFHEVYNPDLNPPSTSNETVHISEDPRIEYARFMQIIYEKLSEFLSAARETCDDEYTLISIQNISTISSSLQFYILAGILPYLENGVGPPVDARSSIIKSWKSLTDDVCLQKFMLTCALRTIMRLVKCNECLAVEVVKRYIPDIICSAYQNDHLDGDSIAIFQYLEELEASSFRPIMISTYLSLCKASSSRPTTPTWFLISIGRRLSKILQSPLGLRDTLVAYETMGGESFWQNLQMLTRMGQHFAIVPSSCKRMTYYENMSMQFFRLLDSNKCDRECGYVRLFGVFIDHMHRKDALAGNIIILDYLFKSWEKLNNATVRISSDVLAVPLRILSLFLQKKDCCPDLILQSSRLFELSPTLLDVISVSGVGNPAPIAVNELVENAKSILKSVVPKVSNIGEFLFAYLESSEPLKVINTSTKLIADIDEENGVTEIATSPRVTREDVLLRRLDSILVLLQELPTDIAAGVLLEILCISILNWNKSMSPTEALRFVTSDANSDDWKRMTSHTVTLFCFDHFDKMDVDFSEENLIIKILNLLSMIFSSLTEILEHEKGTRATFDVNCPAEVNVNECRSLTAKMAIALSASVIGSGTVSEEIHGCLQHLAHSMNNFTIIATSFADMNDACSQVEEVLKLMQLVGITVAKDTVRETHIFKKRTEYMSFDSLISDLDDQLEPTRGYALIRACKAIRTKHPAAIFNIALLFDKAVDLLSDQDSYVFLASINCLAEIALFNAEVYLSKLLDLFSSLSLKSSDPVSNSTCDQSPLYNHMVITRGKLAEAIGKVFIQLGDISPAWLQKTFSLFFNGVSEKEEIIRASCLSLFSNLVLACRGRGVEMYLDEIFLLIDSMLKTDDSSLVRRSCVHLIRQCIRSSNDNLFGVIGNRLRDIRRTLSWLCRWDKDHVVRLHSELCLEEIKYCIGETMNKENTHNFRVINMK